MVRPEPRDLDSLRRLFEERKVSKVKIGGFDVDGVLRGKYVSLEKFFGAAQVQVVTDADFMPRAERDAIFEALIRANAALLRALDSAEVGKR